MLFLDIIYQESKKTRGVVHQVALITDQRPNQTVPPPALYSSSNQDHRENYVNY
jgi:hypothetical protein